MSYFLKLYNLKLLEFEVLENLAHPVLSIKWINEKKRNLLPLGMEQTEEGLSDWIRHRGIPRNRAYVSAFLAKCGLNINRPMDVISACRGLSLNDAYWIASDEDEVSWEQCNLYERPISRVLARIAFTGYGSSERSSFASSPEFTTNGMLPKCWRRENGVISLYKGGTSGASNTGNEPYSELYAFQVGKAMEMNVVPYRLSRWKGTLCSVCELFTNQDTSFVPVGRIIPKGGMAAVRAYYEKLGPAFVRQLNEMIVFDAIICNTDRHFGNFGVLVDSHKNKIISPAPLFDHGNSLFNYAGEYWQNEKELQDYIDTLRPCVYDEFVSEAKKVMDNQIRKKVRKLVGFKMPKAGKINYPEERLRLIEKQVQLRAALLLD